MVVGEDDPPGIQLQEPLDSGRNDRKRCVAPVAAGQPVTTSVVYDPPLLLLTLLLATAAGMLAVVGTARLRRAGRRISGG